MANPRFAGSESSERGVVTPAAAAWRALCLGCVVMRARLEWAIQENDRPEEAASLCAELGAWIRSSNLVPKFSERERARVLQPLSSWSQQECIDGSWRAEALTVVAWALRLIDGLPHYDQECDLEMLVEVIPLMSPPGAFVTDAALRGQSEIVEARDVTEFWHWRARTYSLQRSPQPFGSGTDADLDQIVRDAAKGGASKGCFKAIDDDFPAFGKAYREATEDEWHRLISIVQERHLGLNWLCGTERDWDEVTTDT